VYQIAVIDMVRVNFVGKKKGKKLTKINKYQKLLNLSRSI